MDKNQEQYARALFTELSGYEKRGVPIALDGMPASPMQVVNAHMVREDVSYMRDYEWSDRGDVKMLDFQSVKNKKRL